jgi:hypothetical protein
MDADKRRWEEAESGEHQSGDSQALICVHPRSSAVENLFFF